MEKRKGAWTTICTIMIAVLMTISWGCGQQTEKETDNTIRLAYANWSEGVAMTHLASVILDEKLGYEVVTKMSDIETVFELLESGEYDVFADAWLPRTHGAYMEEYGANLQDLGVNVEQVKTGLVVPQYSNLQSIADVAGQTETITGIGAGAGIMAATAKALEAYNLSAELREGSESSMTQALDEAVKRRENIVITGWEPHWIFNRYELRFLDDPQGVFGGTEEIHTLARQGFTEDHPKVSLFFERFKLTDAQLGSLMDELQTLQGNEKRAVQNWMEANERLVNQWIRGLQPEREKVM